MFKKKYISICKVSMENTLAYRSSFIINISAGLFSALSLFYLWHAIYNGRAELNGYSWNQMKTYLLITFITNTLLSWYSETAISKKILDGSVAMDLLKPLDFRKARLAETIGSSVLESMTAIVFGSIILLVYKGILIPENILTWLAFIVSLLFSVLTKFSIIYIFCLLCFWTSGHMGLAVARAAITNFFSGALVPLSFFPGWLETLAQKLPFKGIVSIPASIYLQQTQGIAMLQALAFQLIWLIVLWLIGKLIWTRAIRQVTIFGG